MTMSRIFRSLHGGDASSFMQPQASATVDLRGGGDDGADEDAWRALLLHHLVPGLGCIVALCMFASPLNAVLAVRRTGRLGDLNPLPLIAIIANCVGWLIYGCIHADPYVRGIRGMQGRVVMRPCETGQPGTRQPRGLLCTWHDLQTPCFLWLIQPSPVRAGDCCERARPAPRSLHVLQLLWIRR